MLFHLREIYIMWRKCLLGCLAIFVLVSSPALGQSTEDSIEIGIQYLNSARFGLDFWGMSSPPESLISEFTIDEFNATYFRDSVEALQALFSLELLTSDYTNSINWLSESLALSTEEVAKKTTILFNVGNDVSSYLSILQSYINTDGGFGGSINYPSNIPDTSLALHAIAVPASNEAVVINNAVGYLLSKQNTDGGWGFIPGKQSELYYTALAMQALSTQPQTTAIANALTQGTAFLLAHQNPDGGFGSSPSTVWETAEVFNALVDSGQGIPTEGAQAISYILTTQLANGSWDDDPYSTALALQALARARPNLTLDATDISTTPALPTLSDPITLNATIHNSGFEDVANITVSFYDGDPNAGGLLIADAILTNARDMGVSNDNARASLSIYCNVFSERL